MTQQKLIVIQKLANKKLSIHKPKEMTTTEEGNHQIAVFNGVEFIEGNTMHQCDRHQYLLPDETCTCYKKYNAYLIDGNRLHAEDLKYHTSWGWLMPVVEKINSIGGYDVIIWKNDCHINDEREILFENDRKKDEQLVSVVWRTVTQFITWHNSFINQK